ncbi:unnamed protein product [Paramecium primaurelia]|uniref:Uncharacterized protein n=1 Tax=Paramecium primaurelia TaxID=5886 RepID=A0A8S1Q0S6_PARPR|nr:unnamed protein product [Paramecium primaurelia]
MSDKLDYYSQVSDLQGFIQKLQKKLVFRLFYGIGKIQINRYKILFVIKYIDRVRGKYDDQLEGNNLIRLEVQLSRVMSLRDGRKQSIKANVKMVEKLVQGQKLRQRKLQQVVNYDYQINKKISYQFQLPLLITQDLIIEYFIGTRINFFKKYVLARIHLLKSMTKSNLRIGLNHQGL